jgi:hypothetical protein
LTKGLGIDEEVLHGRVKMSTAIGALCCLDVDAYALLWRLSVQSKERLRITTKALLPAFVVTRIKQARQRGFLNKEQADVVSPQALVTSREGDKNRSRK